MLYIYININNIFILAFLLFELINNNIQTHIRIRTYYTKLFTKYAHFNFSPQ